MTPGRWLDWRREGVFHVHSDADAAAGKWLPNGDCPLCPHNLEYALDVDVQQETTAARPKAKEEAPNERVE